MFLQYDDCIRLVSLDNSVSGTHALMSHGFPFSSSFIACSEEHNLKNLDLFRVVERVSGKMVGGNVKYGECFMLQHIVSKGFLQLDKKEFSKIKADCPLVSVARDTLNCLLTFQPRLKSRSEGEPVRFDDVVFLLDHKSSRFARTTEKNSFGHTEVAFGREPLMPWRVSFCDRTFYNNSSVLCPGNFIRLQHVDTGDFATGVRISGHAKKGKLAVKLMSNEDCLDSVWEMEGVKTDNLDTVASGAQSGVFNPGSSGMTIKHEFVLKCCSKNWFVGASQIGAADAIDEERESESVVSSRQAHVLTCSDTVRQPMVYSHGHAHAHTHSHSFVSHNLHSSKARQSPNLSADGSYLGHAPPHLSPSDASHSDHCLSFSAIAADSSSTASALSVDKDDTFFLWQNSSKNWVCVREDPDSTSGPTLRLELAPTKCEMDDFRLLRVPQSLSTGIYFMRQLIHFLQPLTTLNENQVFFSLKALQQFLFMDASDHDASGGLAGDGPDSKKSREPLVNFNDPLDDLDFPQRQRLVREMGVLRNVIEQYIPETHETGVYPSQHLYVSVSIVGIAVKNCPKNAEYCAENFLTRLLEWLGWAEVDQLLLVILQSYSSVSEEEALEVTRKLLSRIRRTLPSTSLADITNSRADKVKYLTLLSALCTKGDLGVPTFQKIVLREILHRQTGFGEDTPELASDLLLPIPYQRGIYVVIGGEEPLCIAGYDSLNVAQNDDGGDASMNLTESELELDVGDDGDDEMTGERGSSRNQTVAWALQEMVASLRLLSSACVGCTPGDANHVAVLRLVSFDTLFRLAKDKHVSVEVRGASLELIERVFLCHRDDLAPPPTFPVTHFVWHDIEYGKSAWVSPLIHASVVSNRADALGPSLSAPASPLAEFPRRSVRNEESGSANFDDGLSPEMKISNLKRMVFDFLESSVMKFAFLGAIGYNQSEHLNHTQSFSAQVVSILKVLVRRGFFDSNELEKLLGRITRLLQPNSQISTSWPILSPETRVFRRLILTGCCEVLHYILDLQLNARLYSVFARSKDLMKNGDVRGGTVPDQLRSSLLEDFMSWSEPSKSNPRLSIKPIVGEVLQQLVDLALVSKHNDLNIASEAMRFLLRFFNQHRELRSRVPEAKLFLTRGAQPIHQQLLEIASSIRSWCAKPALLSSFSMEEPLSLLRQAIHLLGNTDDPHSHVQCIALDLGTHHAILSLMQRTSNFALRTESHKFLQRLCKNNPIAQDHLFSHLELITHSSGDPDDVLNSIATLSEIFSGNLDLASKISKSQIRLLASLLDYGTLHVEGLKLLQTIIAPLGIGTESSVQLIQANQFRVALVLKELLHRSVVPLLEPGSDKAHILYLDLARVTAADARAYMRVPTPDQPGGVDDATARERLRDFQRFHFELIATLVLCARTTSSRSGAHAGTEIIQQVLPLPKIRERVCDSKFPFQTRSTYLRALHHVWVFPTMTGDMPDLLGSLDLHLVIAGLTAQLDQISVGVNGPISPNLGQNAAAEWLDHVIFFLDNLVTDQDLPLVGHGESSASLSRGFSVSTLETSEDSGAATSTTWHTEAGLTAENRLDAWAHLASALRRTVRVADSVQAIAIAEIFELLVNCNDFRSKNYSLLREEAPVVWREVSQWHQAMLTTVLSATQGAASTSSSSAIDVDQHLSADSSKERKVRVTKALMSNALAMHSLKLSRFLSQQPQSQQAGNARSKRLETQKYGGSNGARLAPLRDTAKPVAGAAAVVDGGISDGSVSSISPAIGSLDLVLQDMIDGSPPEKCLIKFLQSRRLPKLFKERTKEAMTTSEVTGEMLEDETDQSLWLVSGLCRTGSAISAAVGAGAAAFKNRSRRVQPITGTTAYDTAPELPKNRRDLSSAVASEYLAKKLVDLAGNMAVNSQADASSLTVLISAIGQFVNPTPDKGCEEEDEDDSDLTEDEVRQKAGAANGRKRCFVHAGASDLALSVLTSDFNSVLIAALKLECSLLFDGFKEGQRQTAAFLLDEASGSEKILKSIRMRLRGAKIAMRDLFDRYKRLEKFNMRGSNPAITSIVSRKNKEKPTTASPLGASLGLADRINAESNLRLVVTGQILLDLCRSENMLQREGQGDGEDDNGAVLAEGSEALEVVGVILDLMRWMCEGQFESLQNFLREQPKRICRVSINLVRDVMDFLIVAADFSSFSRTSVYFTGQSLCMKCIDALTECSIDRPENLEFLAQNTDFLRVLKKIFTNSGLTMFHPPIDIDDEGKLEDYTENLSQEISALNLQLSATTMVRLLLTGSKSVPVIITVISFESLTRLLDSLGNSAHFKTLAKLMSFEKIKVDCGQELRENSKYWSRAGMAVFQEMQSSDSSLSSDWETYVKVKYNLGFALIGALHAMLDSMGSSSEAEKSRYQLEKSRCFKFFNECTGRIEVSRNDTIIRHYFPVDILARSELTEVIRDDIRWEAVSAGESLLRQLEIFVRLCDKINIDLEHRVLLSRFKLLAILTDNMHVWVNVVLLLAWAVNLTIIFTMKGDPRQKLGVVMKGDFDWRDPEEQDTLDGTEGVVITIFKVLQVMFVAILYLGNVILEAPASIMRGLRQRFTAYKLIGTKKLGIPDDMEIVEVFSCGMRKAMGEQHPQSVYAFLVSYLQGYLYPGRLVLFEDSICFLSPDGIGDCRVLIDEVDRIDLVRRHRLFSEIEVHLVDRETEARSGGLNAETKSPPFTSTKTRSNKVCYYFHGLFFPEEVMKHLNSVKSSKPVSTINPIRNFAFHVRYFLATKMLLYYSIYILMTFLGVFLHPFFYAFQLLDIVPRSKLLQKVLQAVTKNSKSILLTFLLLFVCVYIYAVVGFYFFRDRFTVGGPSVLTYLNEYHDATGNVTMVSTGINGEYRICDTLFWCVIGQLSVSVKNGGTTIGEQDPCFEATPGHPYCQGKDNYAVPTFFRYMYDLSFYIVIIVVLLNIVLGIIIDGFGELRQLKETTEKQIASTCFICGQSRYDFDHVDSFARHVHEGTSGDHCMWNYLFFLNYLDKKKKTDFDSVEAYIADCRMRNDLSWFPLNRAIVLQQKNVEENALERKLDLFREEVTAKMDQLVSLNGDYRDDVSEEQ